MSVHVLSRFLKESEAELGARIVGIVMSHAAGDDGICWTSQRNIGEQARLSERAVRDAIRKLEELGEVETRRVQRGRSRVNVYRLWCGEVPQYERLPFVVDDPFSERPADSAGGDDRQNPTTTTGSLRHDDRQNRVTTPSLERKRSTSDRKAPALELGSSWTVEGKPVTQREHTMAQLILNHWNAIARQSLRDRDWLSLIIRRLRGHPELDVTEFENVINYNLAHPWWSGPPTLNVIFGSAMQFDRALIYTATPAPTGPSVDDERARVRRVLDRGRA